MPRLPGGRRIEFSLDRFHALLGLMSPTEARTLVANLDEPDDLLFVMDVVHFGPNGEPFFAGCLASDWRFYAVDWSAADRDALLAWFRSAEARASRAQAIDYIHALLDEGPFRSVPYPYAVESQPSDQPMASHQVSRRLQ